MAKKVTIRDVAEAAGLSVTTVSLILNGKGARFAADTQARVRHCAKALDYHPDYFARGLVGQRGNSLGIVVPDILNPFFATFVQQVSEVAIPQGYFPQVFSVNGFHENVGHFIEQFAGGTQRGLILAAPGASSEIVDKLTQSDNLPLVFTDQAEVSTGGDMVLIDEAIAGQAIAEHLLKLGHRRIALVVPQTLSLNLVKRFSGFQTAFAAYGVPLPDDLIFRERFGPDGGEAAATKIVATDATAVIAINDDMAVGVYRGLMAQGKRIPADYSVVGFDDIPLASYLTPQLTTVHQPIHALAEKAVSRIIDRLAHPSLPLEVTHLATRLVVRGSTTAIIPGNR